MELSIRCILYLFFLAFWVMVHQASTFFLMQHWSCLKKHFNIAYSHFLGSVSRPPPVHKVDSINRTPSFKKNPNMTTWENDKDRKWEGERQCKLKDERVDHWISKNIQPSQHLLPEHPTTHLIRQGDPGNSSLFHPWRQKKPILPSYFYLNGENENLILKGYWSLDLDGRLIANSCYQE